MVKKNSLIIGGIFVIALALIFMFVPFESELFDLQVETPVAQVPAQLGDTSVQEMIVVEEPVSMFCQLYPTFASCR